MKNISSIPTGITSKDEQVLVESIPEHSNSDLAGSVKSEDLFQDPNKAADDWYNQLENTVAWIGQSPFMISVCVGGVVGVLLIVIGFCFVCSYCR
jgi:hypothetical protein